MKRKQGKPRRKAEVFIITRRKKPADNPEPWSDFSVLKRVVSKGPFWYRSLWATTLLFCWILSMYQLWDRVQYYLSSPIRTTVTISRTEDIRYPSITACHEFIISQSAVQMRDELAAQLGKERCEFYDVSHFAYLFQEADVNFTRMVEINKKDRTFRNFCMISGSSGPSRCNITMMVYPLKTCATLTSHNSYNKLDNHHEFGILWQPAVNNCSRSAALELQMLIRDDGFDPEMQLWEYKKTDNIFLVYHSNHSREVIPLSITQFTYLSTPTNPCVDNDTYKRCMQDYIHDRVTAANTTCRFPGLGKQRAKTCEGWNEAFKAFFQIMMAFERRESRCPRRCQETLYRRALGRKIKNHGFIGVMFIFLDNVITTSEEYYVYTLVSLLCDIGGNVGLFLSVCVMSMFEITEAIVKRIMLTSHVRYYLHFKSP